MRQGNILSFVNASTSQATPAAGAVSVATAVRARTLRLVCTQDAFVTTSGTTATADSARFPANQEFFLNVAADQVVSVFTSLAGVLSVQEIKFSS